MIAQLDVLSFKTSHTYAFAQAWPIILLEHKLVLILLTAVSKDMQSEQDPDIMRALLKSPLAHYIRLMSQVDLSLYSTGDLQG